MITAMTEKDTFVEGVELFNEGRYFDAHEAWEHLWLREKDSGEKQFLQGLIMAAGAFLHYRKRECSGSATLLERSRGLLETGRETHPEIQLGDFLQALDALREEFRRCSFSLPVDDLPRIRRSYSNC